MKTQNRNNMSIVWDYFNKWSNKYVAEFKQQISPNTDIDDIRYILKDQIDFMQLYIVHMSLGVTATQSLKNVKRLLSMQKVANHGTSMELRFLGGSPKEVFILVERLGDIDIADVYGITEFQEIYIFKGKNKRWTNKSVNETIEAIKDDLDFDGITAKFKYKFSNVNLFITCSIKN
jgi:hypothetical protein